MLMGFIKTTYVGIVSLLILAAASALIGFTAAICYSITLYAFKFWSF